MAFAHCRRGAGGSSEKLRDYEIRIAVGFRSNHLHRTDTPEFGDGAQHFQLQEAGEMLAEIAGRCQAWRGLVGQDDDVDGGALEDERTPARNVLHAGLARTRQAHHQRNHRAPLRRADESRVAECRPGHRHPPELAGSSFNAPL